MTKSVRMSVWQVKVMQIRKRLLVAIAVSLAVVLAALFFVRPGTRSLQVWGFLLTFAAIYLVTGFYPRTVSRLGAVLYGAALWLSLIDAGIRGFLYQTYRTDYFSGFVLESLANTNASEAGEFVLSQLAHFAPWIAVTIVLAVFCTCLLVWAESNGGRGATVSVRRLVLCVTVAFVALFTVFSWSKSSWRGQLPGFSWVKVYGLAKQTKAEWEASLRETKTALEKAQKVITGVDPSPNTVVLVIGESMTSENMSVYGYSRDTTPKLRELAQKGELTALADSWSVMHSTVGAFDSMFRFSGGGERSVNLLALFDAAGYRITWISNQDDTAIKAKYMALTDRVVSLNHLAGRSSASPDEKVLAPLEEALREPYERKLIVVHLIGCHPHYSLRYPEGLKGSWEDADTDAVPQTLEKLGRGRFVRKARDHFDRAILYQDGVIAATLELTQRYAVTSNVFWTYLSDHGQEVGNYADFDGHSNTTPSGYRIPLLIWGRGKTEPLVKLAARRSFRADWVDSMLLEAAGVRWKGETLNESVLSPAYQWKDPASKQKFVRNHVPMVELHVPH